MAFSTAGYRTRTQQSKMGIQQPHKRAQESSSMKLELHLALGMNCFSGNCLAVDPHSGFLVYPSSGKVVFFDAKKGGQVKYTQSFQKISCLSFSPNGALLLVGETRSKPALTVWDVAKDETVAQFFGQTFGHFTASFSSQMDFVVSIGTQFDGLIIVWGWPSQRLLSSNRFKEPIYRMSCSSRLPFFVTCGRHHVKFWYPDLPGGGSERQILYGRPAILEHIKVCDYVDIACGSGVSAAWVFCITKSGIVCQLSEERTIVTYKMFEDVALCCLQVHDNQILISTTCGQVYFVTTNGLSFLKSISHPLDESIGEQLLLCPDMNILKSISNHRSPTYMVFDPVHRRLTVTSNGSICTWDTGDLNDITKINYLAGHTKAVTGMDLVHDKNPPGNRELVVTVSHDSTIRLWNINLSSGISCESNQSLYIYLQNDFTSSIKASLSDEDLSDDLHCPSVSTDSMSITSDRDCKYLSEHRIHRKRLLTVIKVTPDHEYIITGDNMGVIFVHNVATLKLVKTLQTHSRGVSALNLAHNGQRQLMISGGRDTKVCIFNVEKEFTFVCSVKFHSSTITHLDSFNIPPDFMVLSAGQEGTVILMKMCENRLTVIGTVVLNSHAIRICTDEMSKLACVGCRNCEIHLVCMSQVNVSVRKKFYACRKSSYIVHLQHMCLSTDLGALFTACSDQTINMLQYPSGALLISVNAHTSTVSGICLFRNLKYVVSSSEDGCVFFWKIKGYTTTSHGSVEVAPNPSLQNRRSTSTPTLPHRSSLLVDRRNNRLQTTRKSMSTSPPHRDTTPTFRRSLSADRRTDGAETSQRGGNQLFISLKKQSGNASDASSRGRKRLVRTKSSLSECVD